MLLAWVSNTIVFECGVLILSRSLITNDTDEEGQPRPIPVLKWWSIQPSVMLVNELYRASLQSQSTRSCYRQELPRKDHCNTTSTHSSLQHTSTNTRVHSNFIERVECSSEEIGLFLVRNENTHLPCSFLARTTRSLNDQGRCTTSRTPSHSAVSSILKDRSTRGGEKTWPLVSEALMRVAERAPPNGASDAPSD